jgi:hypothetical protein
MVEGLRMLLVWVSGPLLLVFTHAFPLSPSLSLPPSLSLSHIEGGIGSKDVLQRWVAQGQAPPTPGRVTLPIPSKGPSLVSH